jgi:hypothetical protein
MNNLRNVKIYALLLAIIIIISQIGFKTETASAATASYNYGEALQKSILFYEAQRSGAISTSSIPTRFAWRGDAQLTDGQKEGLDLTGGWVDAGDNVKFGLTCAYSAGLLAYGAIEYKDAYEKSGQMKWLQNQLRWVNDYFIKCHPKPNVYWAQVGMTAIDHNHWIPIEVSHLMNDRTAIKLDEQNPGTEVAMDTAAAMAASSIVFRDTDPTYADKLLTHAKQLYEFGDKYRGVFSDVIKKTDPQGAAAYTSNNGYNDELVWGSIWLYKALESQKSGSGEDYLAKAKEYYNNLGKEANQSVHKYKWAHCWDDQTFGSYILMSQIEPNNKEYKEDAERWLNWWTVGGDENNADGTKVTYTPGGHARLDSWGSLRYVSTTALFAFAYADKISDSVKKARYHDFAVNQINYILGSNPRKSSYMIGFGENYPQHPHHRTAHGAWGQEMSCPSEHRHILYGALVGSPTAADGFNDAVDDYQSNEVAIDYNAGLTGALARMYSEFGGTPIADSEFPLPDKAHQAKDEYAVFAKTYFNGTSGTQFSVSVENRSAWPAHATNQLKIRYFFTLDSNNISDISIKAPDWVKVTGPSVWDKDKKIYYYTLDLSAKYIYPGYAWGVAGPEIDFTISSASNQWDSSNDWSFKDWDDSYKNGTRLYAPNMPMYDGDNSARISGNEPSGGNPEPEINSTVLSAIYPEGQTKYNISSANQVIKVKLTDSNGTPLAGKTVKWKGNSGANYGLGSDPLTSVTDSQGFATTKVQVTLPASGDNKTITVDSNLTASFAGDTDYKASTCTVNVYGEFVMSYKAGDVNMDGTTNAIDFAMLKKYLLNPTGTSIDTLAADMNNDGSVNAIDLALLKILLLKG